MEYQTRYDNTHYNLETYLITVQILAITCDNTSSNDMMMLELEDKVEMFDRQAAHGRCFLHIGNLVGKTMVKAFDLSKKSAEGNELEDDELEALTEGLEAKNWQMIAENDGDFFDGDDTDGWVDELPLLMPKEHADLER